MKKPIYIFLILLLIGSLSCTALAAEHNLTLSDAAGQPGQTVYLAVALTDSLMGDSVGISYSYDASVLEAVPDSCSWSTQGVLQDFDNNGQGVWAKGSAQDLKGTVCVLAFRIRSGVKFTETTVSCTLAVQNGGKEVGKFTAEAKVSLGCNHEFGQWKDQGTIGHSRECDLCKEKQTQSHSWDNGVVKENPNSTQMDWKVFTCTVCGATQTYEVSKEEKNPETPAVTQPAETMPSLPIAPEDEERPEGNPNSTRPTNPGQGNQTNQNGNQNGSQSGENDSQENPFRDYNQGTVPAEESDHVHLSGEAYGAEGEEAPLIIQSNTSEDEHNHDHETTAHTVTQQERRFNMILVFVVLALMVGAGAFFLKKKK